MIGVLSALWLAPVGVLSAGRPVVAVPVAVVAAQAVTWQWAALDLAVFAVAGVWRACVRRMAF